MYCKIEMLRASAVYITANMIKISNNTKRNAINAIAIQSHQLGLTEGAGSSFDDTKT